MRHGASGGRVLDLGCGTGDHCFELARRGFTATGVDFSHEMVARASEKATAEPSLAVTFQQGDFNQPLPFEDGAFDHVLSAFAMHYARNPAAVLREIRRVMHDGGLFLVITAGRPRRRRWYAHPLVAIRRAGWKATRGRGAHPFEVAELEGLLRGAGFTVVDRDEGIAWAVQLVARAGPR